MNISRSLARSYCFVSSRVSSPHSLVFDLYCYVKRGTETIEMFYCIFGIWHCFCVSPVPRLTNYHNRHLLPDEISFLSERKNILRKSKWMNERFQTDTLPTIVFIRLINPTNMTYNFSCTHPYTHTHTRSILLLSCQSTVCIFLFRVKYVPMSECCINRQHRKILFTYNMN